MSAGPPRCAGPRQDTPAGPAEIPPADPTGRPVDRRERKTKYESTGAVENRTAPPGHLPPLAWPGDSNPFVPCRGRARPAPWTPKACVHSPSSLPPEPPIPPDWLCRPSGGPRLKFGGKGGLRAPCGKDYPPNPPAKERPNKLGGTRPRQGPSLAGRQSDGGGTRRPGYALGNPPP